MGLHENTVMMRSLIAIAALVLLASCSEIPSKPTTSGGSSASTGGVVRKLPEEPYECNDDLILPAHQPEECRKPESSEPRVACTFPSANNPRPVQTPVEPQKPDPIVGTYRLYEALPDVTQNVFRVYHDNMAGWNGAREFRWEPDGDVYRFINTFENGRESQRFVLKYQSVHGEPDLLTIPDPQSSWEEYSAEGLKVSDDPDYQFDLYKVECPYSRGCYSLRRDADGKVIFQPKPKEGSRFPTRVFDPRPGWKCYNVGRRLNNTERVRWPATGHYGNAPDHGDTLEDCEAICEQALLNKFETVGEGNCSDYQG